MKMYYTGLLSIIIFCILGQDAFGQPIPQATHRLAVDYIATYKDLAVSEMHRTGIPASITLAQGMHESDFGRSRLAVQANNHFGVKCHRSWKGPGILHTDDRPNECFRKYKEVYNSYIDHSKVLAKKRYRFLYQLNVYDYKAWAHGLKKAGYATDPYYAYKLIALIERYALFVYDKMEVFPGESVPVLPEYKFVLTSIDRKEQVQDLNNKTLPIQLKSYRDQKIGKVPKQKIKQFNGSKVLYYTIDIVPVQISEAYNVSLEKLMEWNDLKDNEVIPAHTRIYLSKRRKKAARPFFVHTVKEGETMRIISLKYGMQLEQLYRLNRIKKGREPNVGEVLFLRKLAPYRPKVYTPKEPIRHQPSETLPPADDRLYWASYVEPEKNVGPLKTPVLVEANIDFVSLDSSPKGAAIVTTKKEENKPDKKNENQQPISTMALYHKVKKGETLYRLSVIYKVDIDQIKKLNGLNSNLIYAGSTLQIQ